MRIVLVGTDLAPVRSGAGALETLLVGWATGLAADHDVTVLSARSPGALVARSPGALVGLAGGDGPVTFRTLTFDEPAQLGPLVSRLAPDVVVLNNRPAWQHWVAAPTLHLFHNWPDAWELPAGVDPADVVGDSAAAAVSRSLAATVATTLRRPVAAVSVVAPFVGAELFTVDPRPEAGLVISPNRLMVKKGVRELAAIAGHPSMRGRRVLITDYLSPWTVPTADHLKLRTIVDASAAELIAPPPDRAAMAALYARAEVVVCPSIGPEGLGLTAVEAQAVGVPVVSSGLGGLAEATLLPDLIADPTDPAAFGRAIGRAAQLSGDVRGALREEIRARFSPSSSLDTLRAALARARPPGYVVEGAGPPASSGRA
jgi:hypothetical protein